MSNSSIDLLFSGNEKSCAEASAEDEIFFGPVGNTEKCVAVAVNEVMEASDKLHPFSPLSATQMAQLCREAYIVAYQFERANRAETLSSHAETTRMPSKDMSEIHPVEDRTSNDAEADRGSNVDKALSVSTCGDLTTGSTESKRESRDDRTASTNCFEDLLSSLGSALPALKQDEHDAVKFTAVGTAAVDGTSCADATAKCHTAILTGAPSDSDVSDVNTVEDLTLNVTAADKGSCVDEALSTGVCDDLISGITQSRRELNGDSALSHNCVEGLLSSLGSALPALKQDEHGVVKFTAAADDAPPSTGANAKYRTAVPVPSGLRRASSAKTSTIRSVGIPVKVLTVRQL